MSSSMEEKNKIYILDTTLRDGSQRADISFSVNDKLQLIERFDDIGIDYVEIGFPASNPKEVELFKKLKCRKFHYSKIVAFGMTRYKNVKVEDDKNMKQLMESGADAICVVGKSSSLHVEKVIETSLENNLSMIFDSIEYLKKYFPEVIFDAEHFFDGFKENPEYAIKTLKAALEAGADYLCPCDTNGGVLPGEVSEIVGRINKSIKADIGAHFHNDSGCAVANTIIAVQKGVDMVHGTINGYGERCGNADLCQVIPNLEVKLNKKCLKEDSLKHLTGLSRFVSETANQITNPSQPFVGRNAFTHKGGMHVSGVSKLSKTFEHMDPEIVGNTRRILISELSGKKSIIFKAKEFGIELENDLKKVSEILNRVQNLEHKGYQFEAADGSFELLVKEVAGVKKKFFKLESFRVLNEKKEDGSMMSEATVKVYIKGKRIIETAEGNGPVNALDKALRKSIEGCYPALSKITLTDFKVRVLNEKKGTGAVVRVLIESSDGKKNWGTIGVSENIIEASWQALEDSIVYGLMHVEKNNKS
ncbi:MAG: citramalate synthase [Actinomycetota bacterium]|nr:citramalate synthase [Actinomycetota bacterium]